MFKKILHVRPNYTNTTGADLTFPTSYDPTLTFTTLRGSFSVPSDKRMIIRNILLYNYAATAIKNVSTTAYRIFGTLYMNINGSALVHALGEVSLGYPATSATAAFTNPSIITNLSMFIVLEGGDEVQVGLILRAESTAIKLPPDATHSASVLVSGILL